jgi:hypothetical protein
LVRHTPELLGQIFGTTPSWPIISTRRCFTVTERNTRLSTGGYRAWIHPFCGGWAFWSLVFVLTCISVLFGALVDRERSFPIISSADDQSRTTLFRSPDVDRVRHRASSTSSIIRLHLPVGTLIPLYMTPPHIRNGPVDGVVMVPVTFNPSIIGLSPDAAGYALLSVLLPLLR